VSRLCVPRAITGALLATTPSANPDNITNNATMRKATARNMFSDFTLPVSSLNILHRVSAPQQSRDACIVKKRMSWQVINMRA
jgi:hypothetical protein